MNNSSSDDILNKPNTATCPHCSHLNVYSRDRLLYFRDTMVVKAMECTSCGYPIPIGIFSNNNSNQDIMHG